jgi:hypothetical protein
LSFDVLSIRRLLLQHFVGEPMFLQISKRYTPFSALHQFFPTLPIIFAEVAAKCCMQNTRWCPFKIKK